MSYLDELDDPKAKSSKSLWEGVIADDVEAATDDLFVLIPQIDAGKHNRGPCRWTPRPLASGLLYPNKGDAALVAKDDQDNYWVIAWWPYG